MRVSTTRILRVAAVLTLGVTGLLGASPAVAAAPDGTRATVAAPTPQGFWPWYVQQTGTALHPSGDVVAAVSCNNPACPVTLSQTTAVAAKFAANVGVTAQVVTAGVGFEVNQSVSVQVTCGPTTLRPGQRLVAYATYLRHDFVVREAVPGGGTANDPYVGSGSAYRPIGYDCRVL